MADELKPGDRVTERLWRRAHIVASVDDAVAHVLCLEVNPWSKVVEPGYPNGSWLCIPGQPGDRPTCKTCEKRAAAAARRAEKAGES